MGPATGALRGASRRLLPSWGRRGLSYRGGKSHGRPGEKPSPSPKAVPPSAPSGPAPAQPKAAPAPPEAKPPSAQANKPPPQAAAAQASKPPAGTAASVAPAASSGPKTAGSSGTGAAAEPTQGGGGGTMILLGAGLLGAGAAAYMYFDTAMAPKAADGPTVQLSLDEPVSYPPEEKQISDDAQTTEATEVAASTSAPAADTAAVNEAEDNLEAADTVTSAEVTEEETAAEPSAETAPMPQEEEVEEEAAMVPATEEQQQQAQLVTGLLNDVLAGPFTSDASDAAVADAEGDLQRAVFLQLGLDPKALDAPGLVSSAISSGHGARDGKAFQAAHRQAVSDSEVFAKQLEVVKADLDAKIGAEKELAAAARAEVEAIQAEAKKQRQELLDDKAAELKKQEAYLSMTAAKALAKERADRVQVLDTLRERLNVMGEVLNKKQKESKLGCQMHRLSMATFALQKAMDEGQPFASEVEDLKASAPGDELVEAVARSLDSGLASAGIPTRLQLIDRFAKVSASAAELCLIPEGSGGILAVTLSSIAAKLRISETGAERVGMAGGGIMSATARAQAKLASGQLLAAADELEEAVKGSVASAVVADWAAAAKARAVADQAVSVIQAHATTVAASLAG